MFTGHPAEGGEKMNLDYTKIRMFRENLNHDLTFLTDEKEQFDRQIQRLSRNSQLEQAIVDMRSTSEKLENHIHTVKVMIAVLKRIEDAYTGCEDRIANRIENGEASGKPGFMAFQMCKGTEIFRRLLK